MNRYFFRQTIDGHIVTEYLLGETAAKLVSMSHSGNFKSQRYPRLRLLVIPRLTLFRGRF